MKRKGFYIQLYLWVILCFVGYTPVMHAQIFVNNGAQVTVHENAIVRIAGSLQNGTTSNTNSLMDNAGYMLIDGDLINLNNNAVSGSLPGLSFDPNSTFVVKGNWDNSGDFTAHNSTVELDSSAEQWITGSSITTFHNLILKGSVLYNVKRQTIDAIIDEQGTLQVINAELATDNNIMQVLNANNTAISADQGFISSLGDAYVSWQTNSTNTYEFPVGSSLGTLRKRVARIAPNTTTNQNIGVRFANSDATIENFDRAMHELEICDINEKFYHRIYGLEGNGALDIALQYVPSEDGNWDKLVNWENVPAREWALISNSGASSDFISIKNFSAVSDTAFAFGKTLSAAMAINPKSICVGDQAQVEVSGSSNQVTLTWIEPIDASLPSGLFTLPLVFNVMPTATTIYKVEIEDNGCIVTLEDTLFVEQESELSVSISPDPVFVCEGAPITFYADTAGGGPTGIIKWLVNGVEQIGQNADSFYIASANNGDVVRALYGTLAGCSGEATSNLVTVRTTSELTAAIIGDDQICAPQGQSIPLIVDVNAPSGLDYDITWSSDVELSCYNACTGVFANPEVGDSAYVYVTISPRDNSDCIVSDSVLVCALDIPGLFVPSAFTPNGDTDNDLLKILGDTEEFDLEVFQVYNRWGEIVFETDNFNVGWDGIYKDKEQELDVYVYYLKAQHQETGENNEQQGHVTLLR